MGQRNVIRVSALRVTQHREAVLYVFGVEGRLIRSFAAVAFADRRSDGTLEGYQRKKVTAHVRDIREYLESESAILPNAIVVALGNEVSFKPLERAMAAEWGTPGTLTIPVPRSANEEKPAWIVDGQQRITALSELPPSRSFPVVVVGFRSSSRSFQREQFVLVNNSKPLPRDLVNDLLPGVNAVLPKRLKRRKLAAEVLEQLRFDVNSPFYGRVRGLGEARKGANISQNAVLQIVTSSIGREGVLYDYYDNNGDGHDVAAMARVVGVFFEGVRRTWPEAWSASPKSSRLVHGAGMAAMGSLMDRVMRSVNLGSSRAAAVVARRLGVMRPFTAWTGGVWPRLNVPWNGIENTSRGKSLLTEYLIQVYETHRRKQSAS